MKTSLTDIIIFIIFWIFLVYIFSSDGYEKSKRKYDSYLNKECVIKKDTFLIIDYSIINNNLILNNGTTVNVNVIDSLIVK